MNFEDKEKYLQFRKDWKAKYLEVSQAIRNTRAKMKEDQRAGNIGGANGWLYLLRQNQRGARTMIADLENAKADVRAVLRIMGIPAPDPKVRVPPPPRLKRRWTPEEIAVERYRIALHKEEAHSD